MKIVEFIIYIFKNREKQGLSSLMHLKITQLNLHYYGLGRLFSSKNFRCL